MMQVFPNLLQYGDWGLFLLRLAIGIVFITHGLPKIQKSQAMASGMGTSPTAIMALGLVESISSVALILGIYTQVAAILLSIVMLGAGKMKMMNWHVPFSAHDKVGWEFDLTLLAANIAILLTGGGSIGLFR